MVHVACNPIIQILKTTEFLSFANFVWSLCISVHYFLAIAHEKTIF